MIRILILISILFFNTFTSISQIDCSSKRDSIHSIILQENRPFSVYFPPSYFKNKKQKFPVLYILDGDYNFKYVSGILELQAGIAENIPEMILVAISGKDTPTYRKNCKPNIKGVKDKGNADKTIQFIEKELIPYVNDNYKTNNFKILAGHSVGGIFVVNAALNKPKLFNHYIAISPALWWENNAINTIAKEKINADFKTNLWLSLANEKGMGVQQFLQVATKNWLSKPITKIVFFLLFVFFAILFFIKNKKILKWKKIIISILIIGIGVLLSLYIHFYYYPSNSNFKFKKFPNENHNTVGEPTYNWTLNEIFKEWKFPEMYFSSATELKNHYQKTQKLYGNAFNLPNGVLANTTLYILKDNEEELEKIKNYIKKDYPSSYAYYLTLLADILKKNKKLDKAIEVLEKNKNYSFEVNQKLAALYLDKKEYNKAKLCIDNAIKIATEKQLRQWQINELLGLKERILKQTVLLHI